jgi:hypothetical protein
MITVDYARVWIARMESLLGIALAGEGRGRSRLEKWSGDGLGFGQCAS